MSPSPWSFCAGLSSRCFLHVEKGPDEINVLTDFFDVLSFQYWFLFNLLIINLAWHFCSNSLTLFTASVVLFHSSCWYFIGSFLRFSNLNELSAVNSLSATLQTSLVHLTLQGLCFSLKSLWPSGLQNLNTSQSSGTENRCRGRGTWARNRDNASPCLQLLLFLLFL